MDGDTKIVCRFVGNKVILERFSANSILKTFAELEEMAPSLELDTVKVEGEDKYLTGNMHSAKLGFEALVDVGIIALAHFRNPAYRYAAHLLLDALTLKERVLIPVSTYLGAYIIMTRYLKLRSDRGEGSSENPLPRIPGILWRTPEAAPKKPWPQHQS